MTLKIKGDGDKGCFHNEGDGGSSDKGHLLVVVNSTRTLELFPIFLNFFRSLYVPFSNHVTPALTLAKLPH
jgi:hypothetical protein